MSLFSRDDSELSFQKRQKELKEACHNFKQVLSDIKSISQQSEIMANAEELDEDYAADVYITKKNLPTDGKQYKKRKNHKVKNTDNNNHIDFIINNDEFDIGEEDFPNSEKAAMIAELCQLRAIIRELYSIKYEILNLSLKLKHISGVQSSIATKLNNKISEITQVISANISRAELLLTEMY